MFAAQLTVRRGRGVRRRSSRGLSARSPRVTLSPNFDTGVDEIPSVRHSSPIQRGANLSNFSSITATGLRVNVRTAWSMGLTACLRDLTESTKF